MKNFKRLTTLLMAVIMILQVVLPTVSYAAEKVKLNIQHERPYSDDDGDGTIGNDIYTLVRQANQTVFKIGQQKENGELDFEPDNENDVTAYYCLRAGLGFGSTEEILKQGVDYTYKCDLSDSNSVKEYYADEIKYNISEENYKAICWIADNMYLPKSEYAEEMKQELLNKAGITNSKLTDDDIEVIQQTALWYFSNYDENGGANSLSLAQSVALANLLLINGTQPDNDTEVSYNKTREEQINTLYKYLRDTAENNAEIYEYNKTIIEPKIELDKTLNPTIEQKTVGKLNAFVVGPFEINEIEEGNIDYNNFSYTLKYKISNEETEWNELIIDNTMGKVCLSDANGVALDRTKNVEDMIGQGKFYISILKDVLDIDDITNFEFYIQYACQHNDASLWTTLNKDQPVLKVERKTSEPKDYVEIKKEEKIFDLALRKFVTHIEREGKEIEFDSRVPKIQLSDLRTGKAKTATYTHSKDTISLKRGDTIVYTIRVYNEGDIDGYVAEVTDFLSDGLEFVPVKDSTINNENGWILGEDGKTVTTSHLENTLLKAYDSNVKEERENIWQKAEDGADGLYYADLQIECKIKDTAKDNEILPNIAEITADLACGEKDSTDRDSEPKSLETEDIRAYEEYSRTCKEDMTSNYENNFKNHEDDDDFERVIVDPDQVFDLALRKFIWTVDSKDALDLYTREPQINLGTLKTEHTATYSHSKTPVSVKEGDIVTYKIRVYNEGEVDGYATEITDYLPEGLGLLWEENLNEEENSINEYWSFTDEDVNTINLEQWYSKHNKVAPTNGAIANKDIEKIQIITKSDNSPLKIKNTALNGTLIKKYGAEVKEEDKWQASEESREEGLFYQEIEVTCIVVADKMYEGKIANIAEISGDKAVDENGQELEIDDRDSTPKSLKKEDISKYDFRDNNSTYVEDDDDYELLELKYFDLALKKFITEVNKQKVDTREPTFCIDDYTYHYDEKVVEAGETDKKPVEVVDNDEVTYTIRVFNEGTIAGYAEEIEDDIPAGLIFLPEDDVNKKYGWKMYYRDEDGALIETDDTKKASVIRTTYLSEDNGTIDETTGENINLLKKFNMSTPDFKDVQVVFKVSQNSIPEENTERVIINKAHITKDSDNDVDSIPDEWNEGEDDQDIEKIHIQEFDLALFKRVTKTIVTVNGKTTTTETGFKPNTGKTEQEGENYRKNSEKEPIASVFIDRKKLKSTVVKFVYEIKVTNEGDIPGYATEITDYIPEGLKFVPEDENNKIWKLNEDGTIITRALETVCLNPNESTTIPVTFTWINDANNFGQKTNIAEITEDYNEKGVKDIDSDPKNGDIKNYDKEQEDDDDFALVILTLKTGISKTYLGLIAVVITIIAAGVITIKKYVL